MAPTCEDALDKIKAAAVSHWQGYLDSMEHANDAQSHWLINQDHEAIEDIILALYDLRQQGWQLGGWDPFPQEGPIWWYLTNCIEKVTLIEMIWAYIDADDDHRSAHRLLLDAYQASMYDKPFDKEYHTRWIQRFKSWA